MNIGVVILAAGESARMGQPKQLLPYHGTTLLQRTIDIAHALPGAPVVVVLGAHAAQIRTNIDDAGVIFAENGRWREGMGGSLQVGLEALLAAHPALTAAIFLLCDQPFLPTDHLRNFIELHERTRHTIIASEYGGTLGVPALFSAALFPELLALNGPEGARQIIQKHRSHAIGVSFEEGTVDIDTPADYARLNESFKKVSVPTSV